MISFCRLTILFLAQQGEKTHSIIFRRSAMYATVEKAIEMLQTCERKGNLTAAQQSAAPHRRHVAVWNKSNSRVLAARGALRHEATQNNRLEEEAE